MIDQKKKYDSVGHLFDYIAGVFERSVINHGVDLLDIKQNDYFLDLACGTGKVLKYASKKTDKLFGCDFSNSMIKVAKNRLSKSNVKIKNCDITKKLPYKSNYFDKINFSVTLGMIDEKDYENLFSEIKRVLKKDGLLVVTEYTTKKRDIFTKILELEYDIWPEFQDCKPLNVEKIVKENGFKIIKAEVKTCFGFKFEVVLARKNPKGI